MRVQGIDKMNLNKKKFKKINLKNLVSNENPCSENDTHFIVHCIECNSPKLYILKNYTTGYCFKCDLAYFNNLDIMDNEFSLVDFNSTPKKTINEIVSLSSNELKSIPSKLTSAGERYLLKRNPNIELSRFKITSDNYKVTIPFFYLEKLIYYQNRYFANVNNKHKYYNPRITKKPIYHINNQSKKLIITEGVFDAIACSSFYDDYDFVSILGKSITKYQLWMIRNIRVFEKIVIFLDDTSLSKKLMTSIRNESFIQDVSFEIIESTCADPEEVLLKEIKSRRT